MNNLKKKNYEHLRRHIVDVENEKMKSWKICIHEEKQNYQTYKSSENKNSERIGIFLMTVKNQNNFKCLQ